jgi:hypothetical protein
MHAITAKPCYVHTSIPIRPHPASSILVLIVPGSRVLAITALPAADSMRARRSVNTWLQSLLALYALCALGWQMEGRSHGVSGRWGYAAFATAHKTA